MTTDAFRRMIDIIEEVEDIQAERKDYMEQVRKLDDRLDDLRVEWVDITKEAFSELGSFQLPGRSQPALPPAATPAESKPSKSKRKTSRAKPKAPQNEPAKRTRKKRRSKKVVKDGDAKYVKSVLSYISSSKTPISAEQVRKKVGGTSAQFRAAALELVEQGKIFKTGMARGTKYSLNM